MAAETVIVGCKLPNGLLLQVGTVTIRVNGKARYNMPSPTRKTLNTDVEFADGLTVVDKVFWDKWLADHKDYQPVLSGHIYASPSRNDAVAKAKDTEQSKTGLEAVDPNAVRGLEPTDDMMAMAVKRK